MTAELSEVWARDRTQPCSTWTISMWWKSTNLSMKVMMIACTWLFTPSGIQTKLYDDIVNIDWTDKLIQHANIDLASLIFTVSVALTGNVNEWVLASVCEEKHWNKVKRWRNVFYGDSWRVSSNQTCLYLSLCRSLCLCPASRPSQITSLPIMQCSHQMMKVCRFELHHQWNIFKITTFFLLQWIDWVRLWLITG